MARICGFLLPVADLDITVDVVAWFENATPARHRVGDRVAQGPIGQSCGDPYGPFEAEAAASQLAPGWAPTLAGAAPKTAEFLACQPLIRPGGRRGV